jgi:DNA-binding CsgD family transcriptional regulator/tetratricopeptide (TPR) repeat protein
MDHRRNPPPVLPPPPFVGRTTELASLNGWLGEVAAGRGGTQIVAGAGGIGKTRLVEAMMQHAERAGFRSAIGRVYKVESGVPYAVFSDALLPLLRGLEPSTLSVLTRGDSVWLGSICPAFAGGPGAPGGAAADAKARLLWNFSQFVCRLAQKQPLLLVLENMQWADTASLELLHFVTRQIGSERVGIVVTYNELELDQNPALRSAEQSLLTLGGTRLLRVEPLSHADTEQLISAAFEVDPSVARGFAARLYSWTRGNPFFIEETLKALVESGRLYQGDGRWHGWDVTELDLPRSVRAAVLDRADRLSTSARLVANIAAVVGTRVTFELLRDVSGLPRDDLLGAIDELRHQRILVESPEAVTDAAVRYEFHHPLLREVLYEELGRARAQLLHSAVADALESLAGDDVAAYADVLAFHFSRSEPGTAGGKAVKYLAAAGANALKRHANREAVAYLAAALDGLEKADGDESVDVDQVVESLAQARQRLGEHDAAMALWQRARAKARQENHSEREALVERRMGLACYWSGRYEEALSHFDLALDAAKRSGSDSVLARVHLSRGSCLQGLGRAKEALRELSEARRLAERTADRPLLARLHRAFLQLHIFTGPPAEARRHGDEADALAEACGDRDVEWSVHWAMAVLAGLTGRGQDVAYHVAEGDRLAKELESPLLRLWTDEVSIEYASALGHWDEGLDLAERSVRMARALGQRALLPRLLVWAALFHIPRGDLDRAKQCLDEASALVPGRRQRDRPADVHALVTVHTGLAHYHEARGEYDLAIEVGEAGLAIADRSGYVTWAIHRLVPVMAQAAMWMGDVERAEQLRDRLQRESERIGHRLGLAWAQAGAGLIARLGGDYARAKDLIAPAIEQLESIPWVYDAARLRRWYADVLMRLGDVDGCARELRQSHDVCARLGAKLELERAREMMRELGMRPPARTVSTGAGSLTGRELDIVRLIAEHKTNKEIGTTLSISHRTVSTHVSNILSKLNVSSRSELGELVRSGRLPQN